MGGARPGPQHLSSLGAPAATTGHWPPQLTRGRWARRCVWVRCLQAALGSVPRGPGSGSGHRDRATSRGRNLLSTSEHRHRWAPQAWDGGTERASPPQPFSEMLEPKAFAPALRVREGKPPRRQSRLLLRGNLSNRDSCPARPACCPSRPGPRPVPGCASDPTKNTSEGHARF